MELDGTLLAAIIAKKVRKTCAQQAEEG